MGIFVGTQLDRKAIEIQLLEDQKTGKWDHEPYEMSDWYMLYNKSPLDAQHSSGIYFRKRKNLDSTCELFCVRHYDDDETNEHFYYAKFVAASMETHKELLKKHDEFFEGRYWEYTRNPREFIEWYEPDYYESTFKDLFQVIPWDEVEGINCRGEAAVEIDDCMCTREELIAFAESKGIDLYFAMPKDVIDRDLSETYHSEEYSYGV